MKKLTWIMTIVILLGLVLSACGGEVAVEEPAVVEEDTTENTPAEDPEPVEEPVAEEPAEFDTAALDGMFDVFIDDMEAYNTIGLDSLSTALVEIPRSCLTCGMPAKQKIAATLRTLS